MATTAIRPTPPPLTDPLPTTPRHARVVLILIAALAALLFTWNISHAQYHPFYADSVRSMTESWKAFLYGSFDPGNTITLDKLPGFLWPQALSARLFGFHPWALALPQAIEGVLSVLVLYRAVRTWAGVEAGLLAAGAFALTPVVAGLFRTSVEDPAFTLLLLLAAGATQRAARSGSTRTLLLAGLWVGLAFQAKMLEAFAVLPVLAVVYLLSAPPALRRRVAQLLLAGVVTLAVSASWVLLVTLTPAHDRPYVDGTTDNSAVSMVVGYNFLNRFSSVGLSAADTGSISAVRNGGGPPGAPEAGAEQPHGAVAGGGGGTSETSGSAAAFGQQPDGWDKMFAGPLASQTGWLYPLGGLALAFGLYQRRRAPRTDVQRAGWLLWGAWLATYLLVFSAGSVGGHTYYMGVVAAPLAALSGAGLVVLRQAHRAGGRGAWALPAVVAATAVWGAVVARDYPRFLPWLAPVLLLVALVAVVLLLVGRFARSGLVLGLVAVLIAPTAWTASVFDPAYGRSGMGAVGPVAVGSKHQPPAAKAEEQALAAVWGQGSQRLTGSQRSLLSYVESHRGGARYLFATTSWSTASPYILATGAPVLPIGGFTNEVPSPTLHAVQQSIAAGRLRYVLLTTAPQGGSGRPGSRVGKAAVAPLSAPANAPTAGSMGGRPAPGTAAARTAVWVARSCRPVPAADYGGGVTGQQLYHCSLAQV